MAEIAEDKFLPIPLDGKLVTGSIPSTIGRNFRTLQNCRYADRYDMQGTYPEGIGGMSKVNPTVLIDSYKHVQNGFHLKKEQPAETHVLVQAVSTGDANPVILDNTTAIGSDGNFSGTLVYTEDTSAGVAQFSTAPGGNCIVCDGKQALIWGGVETQIANFTSYDEADSSIFWDYTERLTNTLTDTNNIADPQPGVSDGFYIGMTRPVKGFKIYVETANTTSSRFMGCEYWDGAGAWASVSGPSDGTIVSTKTMGQTGTFSFDSTVTTAKTRIINGLALYWYKFTFNGALSSGTRISQVTADAPMQKVVDIWDNEYRTLSKFIVQDVSDKGEYRDYTTQVSDDSFELQGDTSNWGTMGKLDNLAAVDYIYIASLERLRGFIIKFAAYNDGAAVLDQSNYWDGDSWAALAGVTDNTLGISGTKSFATDGNITWDSPPIANEFKTSLQDSPPMFYYRFSWNSGMGTEIQPYYCAGIPAEKVINSYKGNIHSKNRVWLLSNQDKNKNSALVGARDAHAIFNGQDTTELFFGDETELTCGTSLYTRLGPNPHDLTVICKANEIWIVSGYTPEDFVLRKVYSEDGCVAPLTLKTGTVVTKQGPRAVAIYQGSKGIYMFDGTSVTPIHSDISDIFDQRDTTNSINASYIDKSIGFMDNINNDYHFLYASGSSTTLNKERVFDLDRFKWYEIYRGTSQALQCAWTVTDTVGNKYNYGNIDSGWMLQLEDTNLMIAADIDHIIDTGDMMLTNDPFKLTQVTDFKLQQAAKATTTATVAISHYADGATSTSTSYDAHDPTKANYNMVDNIEKNANQNQDDGVTHHRWKMSISTNDEVVGFEPFMMGVKYNEIGFDKRG